jgi:hypothetical protein
MLETLLAMPVVKTVGQLGVLGGLAYIQNMAFTWSSRSRNSGNPNYHRKAAWCSNGIWFACNIMIYKSVLTSLMAGNWPIVIGTGIVYILCTTEGSVKMMKILLKKEKGSHKVGAGKDDDSKLEKKIEKILLEKGIIK